jgi:hypothetical protein
MATNNENSPPSILGRRQRESALQLGPRKKPYVDVSDTFLAPIVTTTSRSLTDPLIHHGRHFGRSVHAFCNVQALLTNGVLRMGEQIDEPEESFTYESVLV